MKDDFNQVVEEQQLDQQLAQAAQALLVQELQQVFLVITCLDQAFHMIHLLANLQAHLLQIVVQTIIKLTITMVFLIQMFHLQVQAASHKQFLQQATLLFQKLHRYEV